jgi:hypothetical protein
MGDRVAAASSREVRTDFSGVMPVWKRSVGTVGQIIGLDPNVNMRQLAFALRVLFSESTVGLRLILKPATSAVKQNRGVRRSRGELGAGEVLG